MRVLILSLACALLCAADPSNLLVNGEFAAVGGWQPNATERIMKEDGNPFLRIVVNKET